MTSFNVSFLILCNLCSISSTCAVQHQPASSSSSDCVLASRAKYNNTVGQIRPEGQSLTPTVCYSVAEWSGDHDACAPSWQGSQGFGAQVNKCLENAEYLYDLLQRRPGFQLVFQDKVKSSNSCLMQQRHVCLIQGFQISKTKKRKDADVLRRRNWDAFYWQKYFTSRFLS